MKAKLVFQKALFVLDQGRFTDGERLLRDALQKAQEEGDAYTNGGILCCLGDLLSRLGRPDEAEPVLRQFQDLIRNDDVLDWEARRVNELLDAIQQARGADQDL